MEREADIHRIAGSYLNDIFTSCHPTSILKIVGCVEPCITEAEGTNLLLPVTPEEVFEIVKHMNPSKSLGLDGFTREVRQALHGFQVRQGGVCISHLLCADDSVVFCRADEREASCLIHTLNCYEAGSGQGVNFDKS
ncbi:hypothetical protein GBA52_024977 [Prunus armeniaca]|nr:hypothetical protein GBA52_024977 [Prunus armeniaca]